MKPGQGDAGRCVCGHVQGGHRHDRKTQVWGVCLRCPHLQCARFQVAGTVTPPFQRSANGILTRCYIDPGRHTVSLLMDEFTANALIYAARALAAESEAHARELRAVGASLPPDSYGASNRHHAATRLERVATRLRAVEGTFRSVHQDVA